MEKKSQSKKVPKTKLDKPKKRNLRQELEEIGAKVCRKPNPMCPKIENDAKRLEGLNRRKKECSGIVERKNVPETKLDVAGDK